MARIENESQYEWAVARVEELLPLVDDDTPLSDPSCIELVLLSNLVADYDEEHYPISPPSFPEVLKLRMYEMGLTQKSLATLLMVSPSRVSEYMTGKSEPTLAIARKMVTELGINPALVLGVC